MNTPEALTTSRRFVSCDHCGAGAWIGRAADHHDAWCEACQRSAAIASSQDPMPCPHCGESLTLGGPRFEEIYGALQDLLAVLEAWNGQPDRLAPLVPDRPRFLSDLDPPETLEGDDAEARAALDALRAGAFGDARARLEALLERPVASARLWNALAIARQRLGDLAGAERAFSRALEVSPDDGVARLDRGALRARRGDFDGARQDLAQAGTRTEARWNRAALIVLESVATTAGLPDAARLAAARSEAGAPSSYWSDHTVGRLLFTLLVERARARGPDACADARTLRAAERELEFETFDDRALLLHGYASLGLEAEAARVAAPLAESRARQLEQTPFAHGESGRFLAIALQVVLHACAARDPGRAAAAIAPLLERRDLRHYRIPCARCGQGTVGDERVEDEDAL